jgi:hypothetical protein
MIPGKRLICECACRTWLRGIATKRRRIWITPA